MALTPGLHNMHILVVSDTHRNIDLLEDILAEDGPFDMLIHCGDIEGQEEEIFQLTGPECACVMVPGNNDFFSALPRERNFGLLDKEIWVTHGHNYYVSMDPSIIVDEAEDRGVDIVMFGHTHKPMVEKIGNVLAINPGSLTYPRQSGRRPSYIVMDLEVGKEPEIEVKYL